MEKAKKGDRVQFEMRIQDDSIRTCYGVVKKGGSKKATVILDGGGSYVEIMVTFLKLSDQPLPQDTPNLMDKYSIKGYKFGGVSLDGEMYTCVVCKDGVAFANAIQGGYGGPNEYHPLDYTNKKMKEDFEQFDKDARKWCELFGYTDPIDPTDLWVSWYIQDRPYGMTGEQFLQQFVDLRKDVV